MSLVAPPLKFGDTLAVIAPASPFEPAHLAAGIAWLTAHGLRVVADPAIHERTRYTSGSIKARLAAVQNALDDPDVKAVVAARGGYGSVHLLPHLDLTAFARQPKRLIGCSDVTSLLVHVHQRTRVTVYYGPMVAGDLGRGADAATAASFLAALGMAPWPTLPPLEVLAGGRAEGRLTGGCLSLLCASLGTPYELDTRESILFLEDVGEHPYRIDRMLTQLLFARKLDAVRGIVFGVMTGCDAPRGADYRLQDVIGDTLRPLGIPVYFGLPSGHARPNLTLPFGMHAIMEGGRLSLAQLDS